MSRCLGHAGGRLTRNELAKLLELIQHPGVRVHPDLIREEIAAQLRRIIRGGEPESTVLCALCYGTVPAGSATSYPVSGHFVCDDCGNRTADGGAS